MMFNNDLLEDHEDFGLVLSIASTRNPRSNLEKNLLFRAL